MIYCYIDESGSPSLKNEEPFFVAMVIFKTSEEAEEFKCKMREFRLRNNISQDYEFHYSRNASKRRNLFLDFISRNIENYEVFKVEKNSNDNVLPGIAKMIAETLSSDERYRIYLDNNPKLFGFLRKAIRSRKIVAKITQVNSKSESLIQVADYIAGAASNNIALKKLP